MRAEAALLIIASVTFLPFIIFIMATQHNNTDSMANIHFISNSLPHPFCVPKFVPNSPLPFSFYFQHLFKHAHITLLFYTTHAPFLSIENMQIFMKGEKPRMIRIRFYEINV